MNTALPMYEWKDLPWRKIQRDVFKLQKRIYQAFVLGTRNKSQSAEEPDAGKLCAVSRTERIATQGGRSSGYMTPKRTTYLDSKENGNKSMSIKRRMPEDV